jgi:hypothetical protein
VPEIDQDRCSITLPDRTAAERNRSRSAAVLGKRKPTPVIRWTGPRRLQNCIRAGVISRRRVAVADAVKSSWAMCLPARLFAPDRDEINDLDSWLLHAPPEKGLAQWRDGYSAKEQAKSWLRSDRPRMPEELCSALSALALNADEVYGRPEHRTRLDNYSRARQHDLFACLRRDGIMTAAVGIEAKACEGFDGTVADRAAAASPSKKRARCNLLARALFGREVLDEDSGAVLDPALSGHGYQLWTAAVGTVIEAQERDLPRAVLVVQQFRPRDLDAALEAGDKRDWDTALDANAAAFSAFADELEASGSTSRQTEFVESGTRVDLVKVESYIDT